MDLYEYQGRDLFARHGLPVLGGGVADDPGGGPRDRRAPRRPGGRQGPGEGRRPRQGRRREARRRRRRGARPAPTDILGMDIKGHTVHKVMVTETGRHRRGVLLLLPARPRQPHVPGIASVGRRHGDRAGRRTSARTQVAKIADRRDQGRRRGEGRARSSPPAGFPAEVADQVVDIAVKLWQAFVAEDATLVEVNPLAKIADGRVLLPRRQGHPRRERRLPPPGPRGAGRHRPRPTRWSRRPRPRTSTTSSSTARSASSATAPAWSCRTLDVVAYAGEEHGGVKPANFLDIGGGAVGRGDGQRPGDRARPTRP